MVKDSRRHWRKTFLVLHGLIALTIGHSVALSSERVLTGLLDGFHHAGLESLVPHHEWLVGGTVASAAILGLMCWPAVAWVQGQMDQSLLDRGLPWRQRLYDTAQVVLRPGLRYKAGLAGLSFLVLWIATAAHWLAVLAWSALSGHAHPSGSTTQDIWIAAGGAAVFAGWPLLLSSIGTDEQEIPEGSDPGGYAALILFLSAPLNGPPAQTERKWTPGDPYRWSELVADLSGIQIQPGDIAGAIGAFGRTNSWLMPVVSIFDQVNKGRSARRRLEHVLLIVSPESEPDSEKWHSRSGTAPMAPFFIERMKSWLGEFAPRFHTHPKDGVNFENPKELYAVVEASYAFLFQQGLRRDQGILLDLTGGTKQCSLMAGLRSFEPGRVFSYVSTTDYRPLQYDFRTRERPEERVHGR